MSQITTHVLDTAKGKPAVGIQIILYAVGREGEQEIGRGVTDNDGRQTGYCREAFTGCFSIPALTSTN